MRCSNVIKHAPFQIDLVLRTFELDLGKQDHRLTLNQSLHEQLQAQVISESPGASFGWRGLESCLEQQAEAGPPFRSAEAIGLHLGHAFLPGRAASTFPEERSVSELPPSSLELLASTKWCQKQQQVPVTRPGSNEVTARKKVRTVLSVCDRIR